MKPALWQLTVTVLPASSIVLVRVQRDGETDLGRFDMESGAFTVGFPSLDDGEGAIVHALLQEMTTKAHA